MNYGRSEFEQGEPIGVFNVAGGKMRVSDPCYTKDTWCAGVLEGVKDGEWEGFVYLQDEGVWGTRVARLSVKHRGTVLKSGWNHFVAPFQVGVDSGQAGFFNEAQYPDEPGDWDGGGGFYDRVCETTIKEGKGEIPAGQVAEGLVSSSGFGDGGYECSFVKDDAGEVVAAMITFIGDETDEDDEDDCYEDCTGCGKSIHIDELSQGICEDCHEEAQEEEDEDAAT